MMSQSNGGAQAKNSVEIRGCKIRCFYLNRSNKAEILSTQPGLVEAIAYGKYDDAGSIPAAYLREQIVAMALDSAATQEEFFGDLGGCIFFAKQQQYLLLAAGDLKWDVVNILQFFIAVSGGVLECAEAVVVEIEA
jgi:hypothetical protein